MKAKGRHFNIDSPKQIEWLIKYVKGCVNIRKIWNKKDQYNL